MGSTHDISNQGLLMQIAVLGNRSYLINKAITRLPVDNVRFLNHPSQLSANDTIAFCLGYYKIIKPEYYSKPKMGSFVLHATDLPKGRGWAPVNWTLIQGDNAVHLTSFQINEGCDTGPYYMKSSVSIDITDTIISAYSKIEVEMIKHIKSILEDLINKNDIELHEQTGEATWNPRRTSENAELDISKPLLENWVLMRACHNEDYPAFFKLNGKKIYLRYEVVDE